MFSVYPTCELIGVLDQCVFVVQLAAGRGTRKEEGQGWQEDAGIHRGWRRKGGHGRMEQRVGIRSHDVHAEGLQQRRHANVGQPLSWLRLALGSDLNPTGIWGTKER